jgi:hypothetical protein
MSGIQMALLGSGGGSAALATYTLTTGATGAVGNRARGYSDGSYIVPAIGSLSPTTFTLNGGTTLSNLSYDEGSASYILVVFGGTNSGWISMVVDATALVLTRGTATYTTSIGFSVWSWSTSDTIATQKFGAASSVHTVEFF